MKIIYDTEDLEMMGEGSRSLLEICLQHKIPIDHSCEGMGSCGTCRVIVTECKDSLPDRNPIEQEMAKDRSFKTCERLACQWTPKSSFRFRLPKD